MRAFFLVFAFLVQFGAPLATMDYGATETTCIVHADETDYGFGTTYLLDEADVTKVKNIRTHFKDNPLQFFSSDDLDDAKFLNPMQRIVNGNSRDYKVAYASSLEAVNSRLNGAENFYRALFAFVAHTGLYENHVDVVKSVTDQMRQVAAYADAVADGTLKSPFQLFYTDKCANEYDSRDRTLNRDMFDEWILGPFNTDPAELMRKSDVEMLQSLQGC